MTASRQGPEAPRGRNRCGYDARRRQGAGAMTARPLERCIAFILRRPLVGCPRCNPRHAGGNRRRAIHRSDQRLPQPVRRRQSAACRARCAWRRPIPHPNVALIAIAPRQGSVFTRETLAAVEELTEAAWQAPLSTRVDSLTNYTHSQASGDDLIVGPLVQGAAALSDEDLAQTEEIALNAIDLAGRLVSHDGSVAGLAINFVLPGDRDAAIAEINGHLQTLLADARAAHPNLNYYLTGDVVMHRVFGEATEEEARTLVPLVFVIITVAAAILLRSVLGTLALVIALTFTVNTTMGFAGWIGTVLNPANSGIPVIVMTVAIANSIHIVTGVLEGMARGLSRNEAVAESLRSNIWPVFLASATTAIGFLSLNASDSPPFRVLGNLVAFGVLCAFLYSVTVLPAVLSILPLRARLVHGERSGFFDRFGEFVVARRKLLLVSMGLLAVVLVSGIPRIDLTDNWTRYFDERYEFRRDTDFVIDNLTGMETLEFSLDSGREGGITDPEYLQAVDAFAEWCRAQPEVSHVQGVPGHNEAPQQEHARRRSGLLPPARERKPGVPVSPPL